jgi:hypothetical protein
MARPDTSSDSRFISSATSRASPSRHAPVTRSAASTAYSP